jgi:hypothetical protein
MAIIYSYPHGTPELQDLLLGTHIDNDGNHTKSFSISEVLALATTTAPLYKIYTALISQSGMNPPVVITELENTIGTITFGRDSSGVYKIISESKFTLNKTTLTCSNLFGNANVQLFADYEESTFPIEIWMLNKDVINNINSDGIDIAMIEIKVYN